MFQPVAPYFIVPNACESSPPTLAIIMVPKPTLPTSMSVLPTFRLVVGIGDIVKS
jgi:hypothetical protein